MAPHSSTLAWKIPWTEEPGRLQSMGSLRVGHDWVTSLSLFTFLHWRIVDLHCYVSFWCTAKWFSLYIYMLLLFFSRWVISHSLWPHERQHGRLQAAWLPCPSLSPWISSNSYPLSLESVMPSNHFILCCPLASCPQFSPASGSFPRSQLFVSGGQSIGASAPASVLPMNIQVDFI